MSCSGLGGACKTLDITTIGAYPRLRWEGQAAQKKLMMNGWFAFKLPFLVGATNGRTVAYQIALSVKGLPTRNMSTIVGVPTEDVTTNPIVWFGSTYRG